MPHDDPCPDAAVPPFEVSNEIGVSRVPNSDAAIIGRYEPAVRRYCRSRTRCEADAEDAVQETFLRFLRRSGQKIRNLEAWLITAAARACADINRAHQRDEQHRSELTVWDARSARDEDERFSDGGRNGPEPLTVEHLTMTALLRGLSQRERTVVTSLYLIGASPAQVAGYCNVTENNLRQIAFRARRHARALLRDHNTKTAPTT